MRQLIDSDKNNYSGFKLQYDSKRDVWQLYAGKCGFWEGSLKEIWHKMYWDFAIENKEIKLALSEMDRNKHFVASFGILGTFICTFKK